MINRETIWNETYKRKVIRCDGNIDISVLTAIHHNKTSDELRLVAELETEFVTGSGRLLINTTLTPEQMESMAKYLLEAADHQRRLAELMAADSALLERVAA